MTLHAHPRLRAGQRAFSLVEITLAVALLTAVSVMLLKASIQISAMQSSAAMQSLTDAYLSLAKRPSPLACPSRTLFPQSHPGRSIRNLP